MASKHPSRNPLTRVASTIRELRERHEERHRPSGFQFAFADRVALLNPYAWDEVTQNATVMLRRHVLQATEDHGPDNIAPRYAMISLRQTPLAVIAAQIVRVRGKNLQPEKGAEKKVKPANFLKLPLGPAAKAAATVVDERVLTAGNLMSVGFHGIAFAPNVDPAELWPGVADALYRIRRAERLLGDTNLVMVKDVTPSETGLEALRRFSYRPVETEPNMVLAINPAWRSYDDYLSALDAKYRRNARDQMKKLAASGCTLERLVNPMEHASRLHELYLSVHLNAPLRMVTLGKEYLPTLAARLHDDFRYTVIRRAGEILGFVTSYRDGRTAVAYYIGFDRAAAAEGLPLYLRLLHATIGDAIDWGCQRLSLGRTALEPKAAMGAKPETMSIWVRHRIPAVNWIMRGVMGSVTHDDAPERNPFKS